MDGAVTIEGGFAEVGAGAWLMGRAQPAAFLGEAVRRRRKGWVVRDRGRLDLVETTAAARCADASRPFLTHIPCADRVFAVSDKVLVAPAAARAGAEVVKVVPMSSKGSICTTVFDIPGGDGAGASWVVMATEGRTARLSVADGETLSARPEAVVAWTGNLPTGFCPRLGILDVLLPRGPRNLVLHFHGPCLVWVEGSRDARFVSRVPGQFARRPF